MKLARFFARRVVKRVDPKGGLRVIKKDIREDEDEDGSPQEDQSSQNSSKQAPEPSLQSIKMTQAEKVKQLASLQDFDDIADADTQAKKRYYEEQRKFSKKLMETEENSKPEKLVQRVKKETLWGLGGELLRRKESNLYLTETSSNSTVSRLPKRFSFTWTSS